jgi:hypothetical protein
MDNSPFNLTGEAKFGGSFGALDVYADDPSFGYSQLLVKANEVSNYHEHVNGTDYYWVKAGQTGVELNSTYDYQDNTILYLDNPVPNFPELRVETYDDANGVQNIEALKINKSGFTATIRNSSDVEIVRFTINSGSTTYIDGRGTTTGIQYAADYSAGFTPRSLVDKAFVTGFTPSLNVYSQKVIVTANYTATTSNFVIFCNTTGSSFTITLPASPVDGQVYKIKDVGNALINNVIISGNGKNIDGSSNITINTQRGGVEICFDQTLNQWMVMNFVS